MANPILASVDGGISDPGEAMISILDDGLLRGDGAFEMIKLYEGHPFRLTAHVDRLGRSAAAIELRIDRAALESEIDRLLAELGPTTAGLRIVVTRGGRRILIAEELPDWPAEAAIALVTLTPSEILAGVKSISYAANMQATRIAQARGADEAVFVHPDGSVLEAPTSSIFWADDDGALHTPELGLGILDSITRDALVDALEVREGRFGRGQLGSCSECFLASTTREVQAIATVDGSTVPTTAGPATLAAREALQAAVASEREGA